MKRRSFLKACAAALVAPVAVAKAAAPEEAAHTQTTFNHKEVLHDGSKWNKNDDIFDDPFAHHIQHIEVTKDLSREELFELGRKGPYFRYVKFPVEVELFDHQKEAVAEIQKWGVDKIDEETRKEILMAGPLKHGVLSGSILSPDDENRLDWQTFDEEPKDQSDVEFIVGLNLETGETEVHHEKT